MDENTKKDITWGDSSRESIDDRLSEAEEYKLIINNLCTIIQYKGELTGTFAFLQRHLACLGISTDAAEELEDARQAVFEAITEFENLCIVYLSGGER